MLANETTVSDKNPLRLPLRHRAATTTRFGQ